MDLKEESMDEDVQVKMEEDVKEEEDDTDSNYEDIEEDELNPVLLSADLPTAAAATGDKKAKKKKPRKTYLPGMEVKEGEKLVNSLKCIVHLIWCFVLLFDIRILDLLTCRFVKNRHTCVSILSRPPHRA